MPLEILPPIILIPHTLDHYKYQQSYLHQCHSYYPQISEPKKKLSLVLSLSLSKTLFLSMALRKTLAKRLFDGYRVTSPAVTKDFSPSSTVVPPNASKSSFHREYIASPDSSEKGFFRRFLHRRAMSPLPEFLSVPVGDKLREKLRAINITGDRISLDGLSPPSPEKAAFAGDSVFGISIQEAKKILRLSQVEKLKAKLREIPKSSISYSEFVRVCVQGCENEDQGAEFAKMLDDSGNVIVLGNVVFLRPEQVPFFFLKKKILIFFFAKRHRFRI